MSEINTCEMSPSKDETVSCIIQLFKKACKYSTEDPDVALNQARKTSEAICKSIFTTEIGVPSRHIMLEDMITQLDKKGVLPYKIVVPLRTIQAYGSLGSHFQEDNLMINSKYVQPCILALAQFIDWYFDQYLKAPIPSELSSFDFVTYIMPQIKQPPDVNDNIEDSDKFSDTIITAFQKINHTIERLTTEQYTVIQSLKGEKRVLITGCAGSGKTLVAAEKSIRLDRAGLKTLLLCHNPFLASYVRNLVKGTGVIVFSFYEWLDTMKQSEYRIRGAWSHYEEPTEEELNNAFDHLIKSTEKYDAVIVDEGQDFRDTWWLLVETALEEARSGILYIFCDDNQALLSYRSKYPIEKPALVLSRNCRNAGEIFEKIRKIVPQAPETSVFLAGRGHFKVNEISKETTHESITNAVKDALNYVSADNLTILTCEPDPIENSIIYDKKVTTIEDRWQDIFYAHAYPQAIRKDIASQPALRLELSNEKFPTTTDIDIIRKYFRNLIYCTILPSMGSEKNKTRTTFHKTSAKIICRDGNLAIQGYKDKVNIYHYFSSYQWVNDLEKAILYQITSPHKSKPLNTIKLYTVSAFKGLEDDAVILVLPPSVPIITKAELYVGLSRPRIYLHVLTSRQVIHEFIHVLTN